MKPPIRQIKKIGKTVVQIHVEAQPSNWEWDLLLRSDAHHDNSLCDQALEKKHLDEAKERGAGILDIGDNFCAMQGKGDPRSDRSQMRGELAHNNYFDRLVDTASGFYQPYAENWLMMSPGNHETSVLDRHGTNLTERLAERMKAAGSPVQVGSYQGWVQLVFHWHVKDSKVFNIRYTHGYGGGGPVTKDTIQAARQLAYLENADFLISGHCHDSWYMVQPRERIDRLGNASVRDVAMLKIGGYKDEYSGGNGWAAGKGHPPKPAGGWWIRFYIRHEEVRYRVLRCER